jgi:hypothetical protein
MTAAALAPEALNRLIKLAGLLGSAHDGERAAAALKCSEFLALQGLTWSDLLQPPPVPVPQPGTASGPRTWRVVAEEILLNHYGALFAPREIEFLTGILQRGFAPTPKQAAWLAKIARRCGVPGWDPLP